MTKDMVIIKWFLDVSLTESEVEVPEDATDEEIEQIVRDEACNNLDLGWRKE